MNIITVAILFTCYSFAAARDYANCDEGEWANTSCIELTLCPHYWVPLNEYLKTKKNDSVQSEPPIVSRARSAHCGYNGENVMVCCPNNLPKPKNNKSAVGPTSCGIVRDTSSIPDGMPAELWQLPWLALLEYDNGCGRKFGCGGVLISDRHVLTAAHCLFPQAGYELVSVRLGEHDLRTAQDCLDDRDSQHCTAKHIDVGIESKMPHKLYNPIRGPSDFDDDSYDIAVLKLNESVITDVIRPICLPYPVTLKPRIDGKFLSAGWGFAGNAVYPHSLVKQVSRFNRFSKPECEQYYNNFLKDDIMCALPTSRKDACIADWGGPLIGLNNQLQMTVMGIYLPRYGQPCQNSAPSTFLNVLPYVTWIQERMQL